MNVPSWFKRKRPQHSTKTPPRIHPLDRPIAAHWGYTEAQWAALDNHVRTVKRSDFYQAKGL